MHLFVMMIVMQNVAPAPSSSTPEVSTMSGAELQTLVQSQALTIRSQGRADRRSEASARLVSSSALWSEERTFCPRAGPGADASGRDVAGSRHPPRKNQDDRCPYPAQMQKDGAESGEELKFFDRVEAPGRVDRAATPSRREISPQDQYELIGEKITYRLAQRPGSYVILKYHRPVVKRQRHRKDLVRAGARRGSWKAAGRM